MSLYILANHLIIVLYSISIKSRGRMSKFEKQYKNPPFTFGDAKKIKIGLAQEHQERRKKRRTQDFEDNRKKKDPLRSTSQINERREKLSEWRAERDSKKTMEKPRKKPPFIVGVVHHRVYSPITTTAISMTSTIKRTKQTEKKKNVKREITKATKKRLLVKETNVAKQKMPENSVAKKSPANEKIEPGINTRKSFASPNHKFNPPIGLLSISKIILKNNSSSENNILHDESTKNVTPIVQELVNCNFDSSETITLKVSFDEQEILDSSRKEIINSMEKPMLNNSNVKTLSLGISLHTSTATGKENSVISPISPSRHLNNADNNISRNKEDNPDLRQFSLSDEFSIKDSIKGKKNPDIPIEEKEYIEYFKDLLYKERHKLQKLCDKWMEIQSQDNISEDAHYLINQAIGQTNLLINEKFKQFYDLILNCERGKYDMLVTCTDLHGFWDMIYIEVKNCNSRFAKLKNFHDRHWQEEQSPLAKSMGPKRRTINESIKRNLSRELISIDKEEKKMAERDIKDNKEDFQEILNTTNGCITPFINNKWTADIFKKDLNVMHRSRFAKMRTNHIYTSTPYNQNNVTPSISKYCSTSLITMKINQLYNKSTMQLDDVIGQTPRRSATEKLQKLKSKSLQIKPERKTDSDFINLTKPFEEKLRIVQNLRTQEEKINKLEFDKESLHESNGKKSDSDNFVNNSCETVIEKTMKEQNNT